MIVHRVILALALGLLLAFPAAGFATVVDDSSAERASLAAATDTIVQASPPEFENQSYLLVTAGIWCAGAAIPLICPRMTSLATTGLFPSRGRDPPRRGTD